MTTIKVALEQSIVEQVVAFLQSLPAEKRGEIIVENDNDANEYIEEWHRYQEERNKELAALPREEAIKRLYGKA
jgi:hypothetical protein